ncbi:hypothetical protein HKBW3S06_01754, partial [Candidatus Hakubella thermalkaliphila]
LEKEVFSDRMIVSKKNMDNQERI